MNRARPLSAAILLLAGVLLAALLVPTGGAATSAAGHHTGHHAGHHARKAHVSWGPKAYAPGTPLQAHGTVPGGRRSVLLQVKIPGGWHTIARTRSKKSGAFAVSTPLDWYGKHRVRISAPGSKPFARAAKIDVVTPYAPRGSKADFTHLLPYGRSSGPAFTFNPCRTVKYRVNTDEVGPGALPLVDQAFAQISQATGIRFKYVGTSHVIPFATDHTKVDKGTQIVVGWATNQEAPTLTGLYGYGGTFNSFTARNARGKKVLMTRTAGAVLDSRVYQSTLAPSFDAAGPTTGELLLHELGHAMGLNHVTQTDEIMNPQAATDPYPDGLHHALYGAGDLSGLRSVGLAQGCVRRVR